MSVKAKFYVKSITDHGNDTRVVNLSAAISGGNADWSKYTPQGDISLTITNPSASEQFVVGKHYLLTFDAAE